MERDTMTLTNDDLQVISKLLDERLKPINVRLDNMDNRLGVIELKQNRMSKK